MAEYTAATAAVISSDIARMKEDLEIKLEMRSVPRPRSLGQQASGGKGATSWTILDELIMCTSEGYNDNNYVTYRINLDVLQNQWGLT